MDFDQRCAEIVRQTELLAAAVEGADRATRIASCPDWNLGQLLNHIGTGHRWAEETVRTRADHPLPDEELRQPVDVPRPATWLADGARMLAATLREAGPDAQVFTPIPDGEPRAAFYARRFMNETTVHRADATMAAGGKFTVTPEVAHDALEEWLELGSLPAMLEYFPERRELLAPGRTIHLSPTDHAASWTVDLTGEVLGWHPGPPAGTATVTVAAPLADLLLMIYGRLPAETAQRSGDTEFLDRWLSLVSFG
ncbi:maleylpyruvate isomerase family mycothiol-dependent enzyme [Amycolatopsis jejuensis]|uniref:maleylpyruvate isomerase family mycothiol-dependent enzyme n=1 Tax=Amycolatopsis jejuensis TaxID=330084 RepID=UPI00052525AB|nr:maleylpyruvate isomerase family mycothiol-dependent enzyme [Amycolatopsis jejuensis]